MNEITLTAYLSFSLCEKCGPATFTRLRRAFASLEDAAAASPTALAAAGIAEDVIAEQSALRTSDRIADVLRLMRKQGIEAIAYGDADYPPLLAQIPTPPGILYIRGSLDTLASKMISIVGTRSATAYGKEVVASLVPGLVRAGYAIVSGLALGIDACAHKETLECGGRTIAVLGSGIDDASIYPKANAQLAYAILKNGGAIISEFPPGTTPREFHFPMRNRLIAGLSRGVIIAEAARKSGALITAAYALDFNRDVYAVPGSIFNVYSQGPLALLRDGAIPITCVDDILVDSENREYAPPINQAPPLSPEETDLLARLSHEPIHIDALIELMAATGSDVPRMLSYLELKGCAKDVGGQRYIKTRAC